MAFPTVISLRCLVHCMGTATNSHIVYKSTVIRLIINLEGKNELMEPVPTCLVSSLH